MTNYNCGKYIAMAIESIQYQTCRDWELIIVDDRSTDFSDEVIRKKTLEDNRIVYLRNVVNVGCYASKNIGLTHCRGKWITFQDADDHSTCDRLEKQLRCCVQHDIPCCVTTYLSRNGTSDADAPDYARMDWITAPITLFIQHALLRDRLGGFDPVRFGADTELLQRLKLLKIPLYILKRYAYSCLDKWLETERRASLTGAPDTATDKPIRLKYRRAYVDFHHFVSTSPKFADQLRYKFPSPNRPFPLKQLTDAERSLFLTPYESIAKAAQHAHAMY